MKNILELLDTKHHAHNAAEQHRSIRAVQSFFNKAVRNKSTAFSMLHTIDNASKYRKSALAR